MPTFPARLGGEGEGDLPEGAVPLIEVPAEVVHALGPGKRPKVTVSINGHTYRSTVAVYGGQFYLPVNKANKAGAGVELGDRVDVTVELDTKSREVDIPADLKKALEGRPGALKAFSKLSYTLRREHAEAIISAKREETRANRVARVVAGLPSDSP